LVSGGFGIHHGDDDPAEVLPGQVEERQFRDCAGMIGGALVRRVVAIDGMVSKRKKEKKRLNGRTPIPVAWQCWRSARGSVTH
jgi:hypothetical protein